MDEPIHSPAPSNRKLWRYALARVTSLTLSALLLAGLLISLTNDMYAFVKPDHTVTLTVETPLSLEVLSHRLEYCGIIANPTVFRLYADAKGMRERLERFSGELTLSSSMSYRELLLAFSSSD